MQKKGLSKGIIIGIIIGVLVLGVIFLAIVGYFMFLDKGNLDLQERNCNISRGKYELRVYDSQGRVTGLVNGEQKRDIPGSFYFSEKAVPMNLPGSIDGVIPQEVIIFEPTGEYIYEIYGLKEGRYNFNPASEVGGTNVQFQAVNISIYPGETHRYLFDWESLSKGQKGGKIQVDSNSDGKFEVEFYSDINITCEEFNSEFNK